MTPAANWLYFAEQWDPKSPWHDVRVRQAANLALDRDSMNQALFLGYCKITDNASCPTPSNITGSRRPPVYDPAKAKKLLAEAGLRRRLRRRAHLLRQLVLQYGRGGRSTISREVGIRTKLQPIERAGFLPGMRRQEIHERLIQAASGAFGNAATRLAAFIVKDGAYVYGSYPDIDELFRSRRRARPQEAGSDHRTRCSS